MISIILENPKIQVVFVCSEIAKATNSSFYDFSDFSESQNSSFMGFRIWLHPKTQVDFAKSKDSRLRIFQILLISKTSSFRLFRILLNTTTQVFGFVNSFKSSNSMFGIFRASQFCRILQKMP